MVLVRRWLACIPIAKSSKPQTTDDDQGPGRPCKQVGTSCSTDHGTDRTTAPSVQQEEDNLLLERRQRCSLVRMALQDDTISIKERLQHLFLPDAKLTTLERTTVHTRSALLARLDKGVQQLKQMAGSAQRFEVQVGEVEPAGDDTQVVVLRVRQGMLRLTIRAEFVMAVDNGRCRIRHLAFKRGSQ